MNHVSFFRKYFVYFGVFTGNLLSFAVGVTNNWSTTLAPRLNSTDPSLNPLSRPVTTFESSWIVASVLFGSIVGPIFGGIMLTRIGRKKTILLVGVPIFFGHLFIAFANQVWMFLLARFTMGFSLGCSFSVMSSYIGDIAEDNNRGILGSLTTVMISIGGLSVYVVGPYVSMMVFSLINLGPLIALFILFGLFVPETPYDLLKRSSVEEAQKSYAIYTGKHLDADFQKLADKVAENGSKESRKPTTVELLKIILKDAALLRGLKIVATLLCSQAFSGMGAINQYYQTIFDESGGSLDSIYSVMIVGAVTLCATVSASQLVERLGRKLLLLAGFMGMALSLFTLGTYFLLQSKGYDTIAISSLPLLSLMVFTVAYNFQGMIPWILLTDFFPPHLLDMSTTMGSVTLFSLNFFLTLGFPYLMEGLGNYGTFYLFGTLNVVITVYTILSVPETKGKSIEDVQKMLRGK